MRDSRKNNIVKAVSFLLILAFLFSIFSGFTENILINNDHLVPVRNKNIYRILREPEKSIDIIILGDSLSYSSISPMQLWKEHGYTSYVCGQSGQKIWEAENMLRMIYTKQKPDLVILETHMMFYENPGVQDLNDSVNTLLEYSVPVFRGHDIWKSLIMELNHHEENYKGFALRCAVKPYNKGDYMYKTKPNERISDQVQVHMEQILKMCKANNTELLLVSTPSPDNCSYARSRSAKAYAEKNNIPFIDLNLVLKDIGINWKTDSLDHGDHLNLSGAEKVSSYLGRYLSEKYDIKDHRGEKTYTQWKKKSTIYEKKAKAHLKKIRVSGS